MVLRAAFLGNDPWSVPTLEALAHAPGVEVGPVVTNPPRAAGRGSRLRSTAVAQAARGLGLVLVEAAGVNSGEGRAAIERVEPDVIVVVAYGQLLSPDALALPRLGCLNVHFSLLPRWRGAAPVRRAILEGDETTGACVMMMDEGLDTGPVLAVVEVAIGSDDAGTLGARLASRGAGLLVDTLSRHAAGVVDALPQDASRATYAPRLAAADRTVSWAEPAASIVRRVRALAPAPGAETTFRGDRLKIFGASVAEADPLGGLPGSLSIAGGGAVLVRAGDASVALEEVASSGRARMGGSAWARGVRIGAEERLG
jgi:methionyl-tRNA formyltransferase